VDRKHTAAPSLRHQCHDEPSGNHRQTSPALYAWKIVSLRAAHQKPEIALLVLAPQGAQQFLSGRCPGVSDNSAAFRRGISRFGLSPKFHAGVTSIVPFG
jgi:hypothetical protein